MSSSRRGTRLWAIEVVILWMQTFIGEFNWSLYNYGLFHCYFSLCIVGQQNQIQRQERLLNNMNQSPNLCSVFRDYYVWPCTCMHFITVTLSAFIYAPTTQHRICTMGKQPMQCIICDIMKHNAHWNPNMGLNTLLADHNHWLSVW